MTRRIRIALLLLGLVAGATVHAAAVHHAALERLSDRDGSTMVGAEHGHATISPSGHLRGHLRAHAPMWSVPLAGALALVALLALWSASSVGRRERLMLAIVNYRRRGPPAASFAR